MSIIRNLTSMKRKIALFLLIGLVLVFLPYPVIVLTPSANETPIPASTPEVQPTNTLGRK